MNGFPGKAALAVCMLLAAGLACGKPKAIKPSKPVPPGTVLLQFTGKVSGNVDLTVDGMRIPVQKVARKAKHLTISGLSNGKHHIVLLGALEAFGPDQLDVELKEGAGEFKVLMSQQFKSVLYGKAEAVPTAEGIPGVVARLEP